MEAYNEHLSYIGVIARTDELKPNMYSLRMKINWLLRLEQQIKLKIIDTHEGPEIPEIPPMVAENQDVHEVSDTPMLVPEPFQDVYTHYLCSQIDYANGEYERYNNSNAMFQAAYKEYANWYNRTYMPKAGQNNYF